MSAPAFHLCIVQPLGATEALRLLEPALYVQRQLARLGVPVTVAKNRLVHAAVNLVFGARAEFDASLRARYCCVVVNLEPFEGVAEAQEYLELLRSSPVLDFDAQRVAALPSAMQVRFFPDPAARPSRQPLPLATRGADVCVLGGTTEARQGVCAALRDAGLRVPSGDAALYGPERDAVIRDARLVLDLAPHFDEPLAAHVLDLGTPYARWQHGVGGVPPEYAQSVECVAGADGVVRLVAAAETAGSTPERAARDAGPGYAAFVARATAMHAAHVAARAPTPWQPARINIGSGREYLMGWLNLDIAATAQPDALIDLGRPLPLPFEFDSLFAGRVRLAPSSADLVFASNVLEHVPDLVRFATQVLALLRTGGDFLVEVPYERAPEAWQDPTHVRAMNENSWKYFTGWFWYLGWFEHRFALADMQYLDEALEPCGRDDARFMRVLLRKVETTAAERIAARTAQPDFGGLLPPLPPHGGRLLNAADPGDG